MAKIFRPWAFFRQLQYGTAFIAMVSLFAVVIFFTKFYQPPNCFDLVQNGNEGGVDCDGSCVRMCVSSVIEPKVVWAESFKIIDGQYNAVAYIENKNETASTPELAYIFRLYDGEEVIAEKEGVTILPPNSVYPVFEGRILTADSRKPTRITIEIKPADMWLPASIGREQFKTISHTILGSDSKPRLKVELENTDIAKAEKVEIVATIFNNIGGKKIPVTASQTFIDVFPGRSAEDVVFTWPNPIGQTVRSCEIPSDILLVLDRSGSMAADGGDPPEPLESAKNAAASFARLQRTQDLLGYFSYATDPTSPIEQILTNDSATVVASIKGTKMGEEGVQYTNIGEAFSVALKEFATERHREDARKVIILMTDGDVTRPVNPETGLADRDYAAKFALEKANEAKNKNVTVYTIGFGDFFNDINESVERDTELIKNMSTSKDHYFEAPTVQDLENVYKEIAGDICEVGSLSVDIITKTKTNFTPLR